MSADTMALTYAGKIGFAKQLQSIIQEKAADLRNAKMDVDGRGKEMTARLDVSSKEDARQEAMKADLKAQTGRAVAATNAAYSYASDTADLIVGALGKSHELSKRIRKLREQMTRPGAKPKKVST